MFVGIIQGLGIIESVAVESGGKRFTIRSELFPAASIGASVSINGACHTFVAVEAGKFQVYSSPQTLDLTNLNDLVDGDAVNLEPAATPQTALDGHLVQGHIDGKAALQKIEETDGSHVLTFSLPADLAPLVAKKGSIAIDGISLTVFDCGRDWFSVMIIPHTWTATCLQFRKVGDSVNLEVDMMARYVQRILSLREA